MGYGSWCSFDMLFEDANWGDTYKYYYWDTDPGLGNGISFVAIDGNFDLSITVPAQGVLLSLRLKDEDCPALSSRTILIQAAEYFWDTDPGVGNGTPLLAFDGSFDQALGMSLLLLHCQVQAIIYLIFVFII